MLALQNDMTDTGLIGANMAAGKACKVFIT